MTRDELIAKYGPVAKVEDKRVVCTTCRWINEVDAHPCDSCLDVLAEDEHFVPEADVCLNA